MSDKPYDKMTHDEILREHSARYAQMSPEQRAEQSEARTKLERERLAAEARRLKQPLSELTLGGIEQVRRSEVARNRRSSAAD
jgi:hypothetical protein